MFSPQQIAILQIVSMLATTLFIALLVAFELTPAARRRHSFKVLLPCFMTLGVLIISGALIHAK